METAIQVSPNVSTPVTPIDWSNDMSVREVFEQAANAVVNASHLAREVEGLRRDVQGLRDTIASLGSELAQVRRERDEAMGERDEWHRQYDSILRERDELRLRHDQAMRERDGFRDELEYTKIELDDQAKVLAARQEDCTNLDQVREALNIELDDARRALQVLRFSHDDLVSVHSKMMEKIDTIRNVANS